MKMATLVITFCFLVMGCGGDDASLTTGSASAGSGGTANATGPGGSGGTSTATATTGTGGSGGAGSCEQSHIDGALACFDFVDTATYPNPLLGYDPAENYYGGAGPILPDRPGAAAAAVRLGPFGTATTVTAARVRLSLAPPYCAYPEFVRVAVWSEPQCGLPQETADAHAQPLRLFDDLEPTPVQTPVDAATELRYVLDTPVMVGADESVYVALLIDEPNECAASWTPTGSTVRSMWYGYHDGDCDGVADLAFGWDYLAKPSAPTVTAYDYDFGFAIESD